MDIPHLASGQKRIVIVGAGFAGLNLAKRINAKHFQVVLIDKNNYHQFQPLLYQVVIGGLEPSNISFPLRKIFRKKKNHFIRVAELLSIESESKVIHTTQGQVSYDDLILAQGSVTNYFQHADLKQNAYAMKSVSEALLLKNTLLQNYEKALITSDERSRAALLNVVIVGGGPTGVELAGAIAELRDKILPKDYSELDFSNMHITLVEATPSLLNGMSEASGNTVRSYLTNMGVEVKTGTLLQSYDGEKASLSDGSTLYSKCVIMAAGVVGATLKGIPTESVMPNGRILVNAYNQVMGLDNVYAIGDIAMMRQPDLQRGHPQVAQVAIQQAKCLAINLSQIALGKTLRPFQYNEKGIMATVGHNKAIVEIGTMKWRGFIAWFVWMFVHLISLIGFKNRLFVFINWVWQYFTYDPSLRMIIKPSDKHHPTPPPVLKEIAITG